MVLKHSVYDTDTHFIINPVTRTLHGGVSPKNIVIQYDHNSERFTFEVPRYIEGHDMSLCNIVQVHYNNIDVQTKVQSKGVYPVDDMQISPDSDDVVILSWLISHNATKYVGSLNFLIRFSCVDEDGTVNYAWNTAIYSGVSVSSGIYNSEAIVDQYADVLNDWYQELFGISDSALNAIVNAETQALTKVNDAETQALGAIETEKEKMLDEIELAADIVQTTGDSKTAVMSQNAVTDEITGVKSDLSEVDNNLNDKFIMGYNKFDSTKLYSNKAYSSDSVTLDDKDGYSSSHIISVNGTFDKVRLNVIPYKINCYNDNMEVIKTTSGNGRYALDLEGATSISVTFNDSDVVSYDDIILVFSNDTESDFVNLFGGVKIPFIYELNESRVKTVEETQITNELFNLFNKADLLDNTIISIYTNGKTKTNTGISSTPLIPIEQGHKRIRVSQKTRVIAIYDENKNYVNGTDANYFAFDLTGGAYFAVSFIDAETDYDSLMITYTDETGNAGSNIWDVLFPNKGYVPYAESVLNWEEVGTVPHPYNESCNLITPKTFEKKAMSAHNVSVVIDDNTKAKYFTFDNATSNTVTWLEMPMHCVQGNVLLLEFYGKTSNVAYSPTYETGGMLIIEFFDESGNIIGGKYNAYVLGVNRMGYHRYGYVAPMGAKYAILRVVTRGNTSISIHDVSVKSMNRYPQRNRTGVLIDGHLGAMLVAPENTIPSIELGLKLGYNLMVVNVQETSDGELVCIHDATIDRTSNGTGNVASYTFEQLQEYDFGSWFNTAYTGTKIPKFEDAVQLIQMNGAMVGISLHSDLSDNALNNLYAIMKKHGCFGNCMIKTASATEFDRVYNLFGDNCEYVYYHVTTTERIDWIYSNVGNNITIEFAQTEISEELVKYALEKGFKCSMYFGNDTAQMKECLKMGIARFTVDTFSDITIPFD